MSKLTLRDATERWVSRFDRVPVMVLRKMARSDGTMYFYDSDSLRLVASPNVQCFACGAIYEGQRTLAELTSLQGDAREPCPFCKDNRGRWWTAAFPSGVFPCGWSPLFAPRERSDIEWMLEHAREVAQLGLFVFESEDYGVLLGVDGAGFDFCDAFWEPLYQLRGLQWHEQG